MRYLAANPWVWKAAVIIVASLLCLAVIYAGILIREDEGCGCSDCRSSGS